jgi:predicted nucleotidyltransferase component of viral defense system
MAISLEEVRRRILIAMFSDDELMDELVLKGGNALALRLSSLIELARTLDLELIRNDLVHGNITERDVDAKQVEQGIDGAISLVRFLQAKVA